MLVLGDWLILSGAGLLIIGLYWHYWGGVGGGGDFAVIRAEGRPPLEVDLTQSRVWEVEGSLGVSRLETRDGKIRFMDSPCRNKLCIRQGWLEYGGEYAACLPNRVGVQVRTAEQRFDSLVY